MSDQRRNGFRDSAGEREPKASTDVSRLLQRLDQGDREAFSELMPLVYDELHAIASAYMRRERPDHTFQPTALVNEAYLRLSSKDPPRWSDRAHFYRAAAAVMRAILVNHARDRQALKREAAVHRVPLDEALAAYEARAIDLIALDEALERLAVIDARQATLVELRFFAGLSMEQTAEVLGVSARTVDTDWKLARAWLSRELSSG